MKEEVLKEVAGQESREQIEPPEVGSDVRGGDVSKDSSNQDGGVMKSLKSLVFFVVLLAVLYWMNQRGLLGFLNEIGTKPQVEEQVDAKESEHQVDMPALLEPYFPEVQQGMERWCGDAGIEDEIHIQRLRHSDDFQKLLVEYERVDGDQVWNQTMVLERDEFARFVYADTENDVQVVVYSPANHRALGRMEDSE